MHCWYLYNVSLCKSVDLNNGIIVCFSTLITALSIYFNKLLTIIYNLGIMNNMEATSLVSKLLAINGKIAVAVAYKKKSTYSIKVKTKNTFL